MIGSWRTGRVWLAAALALLVAGCSSTHRAPVVNREHGFRASVPSKTGNYYWVRPGDTLYAIAWQAGLDYKDLAAWNRLSDPDRIHVGQRLRLRPPPLRPATPARRPPPPKTRPPGRIPKPAATRVDSGRSPVSTPALRPAPGPKPSDKPQPRPAEPSPTKTPASSNRRLAWSWPTTGRVVERFSASDRTRNGVKIAGQSGQPILAAEAGKIVYSGSGLIGYGQLIIIKHNKNYLSAYGHNRKILVKEGDQVARGERIAEMGKPPDDQPLLHFEIRRQGTPVDPLRLLPKSG